MKKLFILSAFVLFAGSAFGQSFQKEGVLSVHTSTITLVQDITMDQYLAFLEEKILPEFEKLFDCEVHSMKGINREIKGQYGWLAYYKSKTVFNKYWNDDGSATEKGAAAVEKLQTLLDELQKLGSATEIVNDWVIR